MIAAAIVIGVFLVYAFLFVEDRDERNAYLKGLAFAGVLWVAVTLWSVVP